MSENGGGIKMKDLNLEHYDDVNDILLEALEVFCGIKDIYYGVDNLEKDVEYITGAINIVKLGDKSNTLKHKQGDIWSEDVEITESYANSTYYIAEQIKKLISSLSMTRKHCNDDF